MNEKIHKLNMQHLAFQRNAFLGLSFILVLAVIVLVVMISLKSEKIIVVPHSLSERVWAKGNQVSASYLKQQANVITMLLLSKTFSSSQEQNEALLAITHPSMYGKLKKKLLEEQEVLSKEGISYVFIPSSIKVDEGKMSAETVGERLTYLSGKVLAKSKEKYTYQFTFNGQILLLSGVFREEVGNE